MHDLWDELENGEVSLLPFPRWGGTYLQQLERCEGKANMLSRRGLRVSRPDGCVAPKHVYMATCNSLGVGVHGGSFDWCRFHICINCASRLTKGTGMLWLTKFVFVG